MQKRTYSEKILVRGIISDDVAEVSRTIATETPGIFVCVQNREKNQTTPPHLLFSHAPREAEVDTPKNWVGFAGDRVRPFWMPERTYRLAGRDDREGLTQKLAD